MCDSVFSALLFSGGKAEGFLLSTRCLPAIVNILVSRSFCVKTVLKEQQPSSSRIDFVRGGKQERVYIIKIQRQDQFVSQWTGVIVDVVFIFVLLLLLYWLLRLVLSLSL